MNKIISKFLSLYDCREYITSIMYVIMMNEEIDMGRLDSFPFLLSRSGD
ncbi:hypothetical protein [Xylanibacter oryzae]|nr:hypothetical protein [Xylanibacter oryzae]